MFCKVMCIESCLVCLTSLFCYCLSKIEHNDLFIWLVVGGKLVKLFSLVVIVTMDVSDDYLKLNRDWDPSYLSMFFSDDFYVFLELWSLNMGDKELVNAVEKLEIYSPIVEYISLDDNVLYQAVKQMEQE